MKLYLPNVTLFGIDCNNKTGIRYAFDRCKDFIDFGAEILITEKLFEGREGYSKFCISEMVNYIPTSHVLIIHSDSWIMNHKAWDDSWLKYDYIGATWWFDTYNVGNGGFSLRSKNLLLEVKKQYELLKFNCHPEDEVICRTQRKLFNSFNFAPDDIANKFSIEKNNEKTNELYTGQFGFHGNDVIFKSNTIVNKEW